MSQPLENSERAALDAWWRAANYLTVGQIYLRDNPLLARALRFADVKPRLLGHWGTSPGLNFVYAHLNRAIRQRDLDAIYVTGPGHGGPAIVANTYLEGTYSELFPDVTSDAAGLKKLFTQFSYPGGIPSHAAPETPGSINEGGELGYSLAHAFGAAFDNPDLLVACVVGDGEAETGALATSWHSNKFLNPARDGAVLPILHLNGYKIAGPTVLARIDNDELDALFRGYGYTPHFVEGDDPLPMHDRMAAALDAILDEIARIQSEARRDGFTRRPRWPMLILRTPKGWTGPREVDGKRVEGTFRAHQVPLDGVTTNAAHLAQLEAWLRSYRPEELFDANGTLRAELRALAPEGKRRMSANPHANGGRVLRDLELPDFRAHAVAVAEPGSVDAESTRVQGRFVRDILAANAAHANFRIFSPDETASNRWDAVFDVTSRCSTAEIVPDDENVAPDGRVMEMLSEHQCQGWLEGYLLTGRHGVFSCYEAFVHVIDSMFNQHAKWLESARGVPWREPIASLNIMLTSHVWRQDHNGFSHQDPGFLDVVCNKKPDIVRVYLPPDANTLLAVTDLALRSRDCVNVVVAGKHEAPQWLGIDAAIAHCAAGVSIWDWAGTEREPDRVNRDRRAGSDQGEGPDVVLACAGDVPTLETLAAASIARARFPGLSIRVVNVVDLMRLHPASVHPHGLDDATFDAVFTRDRPVVFDFHGYPSLIHRLIYARTNHDNFHVRGYIEEGTTTTPFDMAVLNRIDRFHLVAEIARRVPSLADRVAETNEWREAKLDAHKAWIRAEGIDLPEIRDWRWQAREPGGNGRQES